LSFHGTSRWHQSEFSHSLGNDRLRALNKRYHVSLTSVESKIRSLPLTALYRVAIKLISLSLSQLSFETLLKAKNARLSNLTDLFDFALSL